MRPYWRSPRLETEFLTAFLESSQLVKMDGGFGWDDVARGRKDIRACF